MRKTVLLTGAAALLLMSAPAFAQDALQEPAPAAPVASAEAAPQATLALQPGTAIKASDGTVIGKLEGARMTTSGQELTVRGLDGQVRAIPVSGGVRQDGTDVVVGWTAVQFQAAAVIADRAAPAPAAPVADPTTDPVVDGGEPSREPLSETGQAPLPGEAEQLPPPVDSDETPTETPPGV